MRNWYNRLWSVLLAAILMMGIIPIAHASDLSKEFQLITGVEITVTDHEFEPLDPQPDPVPVDAYFQLKYNFKLPADAEGTIVDGDYYYLDLPPQIKVAPFGPEDLKYDGETLATWQVVNDPNNRIKLTFTEYAGTLSNITGSFWLDLRFKKEDIGPGGSTPIKFDLGGNAETTVDVNFEEDMEAVTLSKSGSYNASNGRITWTIRVNENSKPLTNLVIRDTLAEGQTYRGGSYRVTPSGGTVAFVNEDGALTWTFTDPNPVTQPYTITFDTTSDIPGPHSNQAFADYVWGTPTTVDSNPAEVIIPIQHITKSGEYQASSKSIKWTVDLNPFGLDMGNVTFKDTLPAGLTLDPQSVSMVKHGEASPVSSHAASASTGAFTASLGAITERKTITYTTKVADSLYQSEILSNTFTNAAEVSHSGPAGGPGANSSDIGVDVPFSMFEKTAHAYDPATGQITWRLEVNRNRVPITNPVITDTIPSDQSYVPNSYRIFAGDSGIPSNWESVTPLYNEVTGVLTAQYTGTTTDGFGHFIVEFKTEIKDKTVWQNNQTKTYTNEASLKVEGRDAINRNASKEINSEVIRKAFTGYNHQTRQLTWDITINENKNSLTGVRVTDYIPAGYKYIGVTYQGGGALPDGSVSLAGAHPTDSAAYPSGVQVSLGAITDTVRLTITTELEDLDVLLEENGEHTATNRAGIVHTELPDGREITVEGKYTTTVAKKGYHYAQNNRFIDWSVNINQANLSLTDVTMTDTLQEGLALDLDHIHLYEATLEENGSLTQGAEITIGPANVQYNAETRAFTFNMPATPITRPYILRFRTQIVDDNQDKTYTNAVNFSGSGQAHSSTTGGVNVEWQGQGQQIEGEVGSISINKTDDVTGEKLQGAVFELYNTMGLLVATATTGEDGTAMLFDRALLNRAYTVKEKAAPHGYTGPVYETIVTLEGTAPGRRHVTLAFTNTRNGGYHTQITASKRWSGLEELDGTRPNVWFELWRKPVVQGGTPERVPGAGLKQLDGETTTAVWNTLPVTDLDGNTYTYFVKEVDQNGGDYVPEGYEKTEDGLNVVNRSLKKKVTFSKTAINGTEELAGAGLSVYAGETGTGVPVDSWISTTTAHNFLLVPGIYTMVETSAPAGFVVAESITFRVNADDSVDIKQGEAWVAANNATVRMKDAYAINFSKTAVNGTAELPGAELKVYRAEGEPLELVDSWTSTAVQKVIGLEPGTYIMEETSAPAGFVVAESITFRVNADGSVDIKEGEAWVSANNATVRM